MEAYAVYIQKTGPRFRGTRTCHVCSCRGGKEQCRWSRSNHNAVVAQVPKGEKLVVVIQPLSCKQQLPKDATTHILKDCRVVLWFLQPNGKQPLLKNTEGDKYMVDGSKVTHLGSDTDQVFVFEPYLNMSDNPTGYKDGGDNYTSLDDSYPNVWV